MNEGGAVQRESRRLLLQPMEATMNITLDLTRNEIGMLCSALDLKATFDADEEHLAEYRTEFRLLVRKFAVAWDYMNTKNKN